MLPLENSLRLLLLYPANPLLGIRLATLPAPALGMFDKGRLLWRCLVPGALLTTLVSPKRQTPAVRPRRQPPHDP